MSETVGSLALRISANAEDLDKALDRAQGKISAFAAKAQKPFELADRLGSLFTDPVSKFLGPLAQLACGGRSQPHCVRRRPRSWRTSHGNGRRP